jgi:urease accessory protein
MSMGEEWAFSRYYSINEIFLQGKRIAKDVMLLDDTELGEGIPSRPLSERLKPYSCYAMLFLHGPQLLPIIATIMEWYNQITVFKTKEPARLIWSVSPIDSTKLGIVVRVAGVETEIVKGWLKGCLAGLEAIIGRDAYKRVFP